MFMKKKYHFVLFIIIYLHHIISCSLDFVKTLNDFRAEKDKYVVHATDRLPSDRCILDKNESRKYIKYYTKLFASIIYYYIYI